MFGMSYLVPQVVDWPGTIVAVNVGGALIPTLLSLYLVIAYALYFPAAIATAIVAVVVHQLATPIPGVGISVPLFWPPILAAIVAIVLSRRYGAPIAYVAGSIGVLIGADLTNLDKLQSLGAPVASIGGAGTFDGVFLAGVAAVLLSGVGRRRAATTRRAPVRCEAQLACGSLGEFFARRARELALDPLARLCLCAPRPRPRRACGRRPSGRAPAAAAPGRRDRRSRAS